jgi:rhamnosyltransferase
MSGVCAAVISYHPSRSALADLLQRLSEQADRVLLVENASPDQSELIALANSIAGVTVLPQAENRGIAGGINIVWRWAHDHGCRHLVPFDQDSVPAEDMIGRLVAAYEALVEHGLPVGAVGAQQVSVHDDRPVPFVRFRLPLNRRLWRGELPNDCVECDFLISSGSLLPVAVLDEVGPMDEALFIDNVDLEWGFRARRAGYRLSGCFAARMGHRIGEAERHLAGLRVRDHAPLRQYYMTRNRIALYRRPYTPWAWIVHDVPRLTMKALYLTLIAERRREHRRMLVAAVRDVRRGHFGHFEAQD